MNYPAKICIPCCKVHPKAKIKRRRWSTIGFLWLAMAVAICQAWPANSQERPKETLKPVAGPADTPSVKQGAAKGGPTARPLKTGAAVSDAVTLNFINADIEGVVKAMSEITGRNFVLDSRVKGTVNIISAKPMPRALVYDVFLSALRLQGFAAIEDGGFVKIVPEADAKLHPSPTFGQSDRARVGGDRIETRVFTLKYESAAQMLPILRPLIAPVTPLPHTRTAIRW